MTNGLFAAPREVTRLKDCLFYHTVDLPDYGTIEGYWDIRGGESQYLGDVSFAGRRVFEVGPASGHLTFFMERQGARVVSLEAADARDRDYFWDLDETLPGDLESQLASNTEHLEKVKNSYWLCHRAFSSEAEVLYGSAYSVPRGLGEFDLSVVACVLLHTKNPLRILENCARLTREAIIVVEPFRERQLAQTGAEFLPAPGQRWWDTWWGFSPKYFVDVLGSLGFRHSRVTFHTQRGFGEPCDLFTVVASRAPLGEAPPPGARIEAELFCPAERLKVRAGRLIHLPVCIANRGEASLSSLGRSPLLVSYHWRRRSGEAAIWDGVRTALTRTLFRDDEEELMVAVRAPEEPGDYLLELTLVSEGVRWHDDDLPGLPLKIETAVTER